MGIAVLMMAMVHSTAGAQSATEIPSTDATSDARAVADSTTHGVYLPQLTSPAEGVNDGCPAASDVTFDSVEVVGPSTDRPPRLHADLNLSLRGYSAVSDHLRLVDINGPADEDAPQLAGLSDAASGLDFVATYRIHDWNWSCEEEHGCRNDAIISPPVTMLSLTARRGAPVRTPPRRAEIHEGGHVALVLYAEQRRITLVYTREDSVAHGYAVHIEDICVDPALLALYRRLNAAGRSRLPALHSLEQLGRGNGSPVKVAVRDSGSFMDPRSRKDWWKGY